MGRRWIGIESGDHLVTLAEPRLRRVVDGEDATGVTSAFGFGGGGGFRVASVES
jgi:adenine-specific DNA-methyltransferase